MEVPEASLDADSQAQRLQHAKLEQVLPHLCTFCVYACRFCRGSVAGSTNLQNSFAHSLARLCSKPTIARHCSEGSCSGYTLWWSVLQVNHKYTALSNHCICVGV